MNCVRDMVISSQFFNISSSPRLNSCLNGLKNTVQKRSMNGTVAFYGPFYYTFI